MELWWQLGNGITQLYCISADSSQYTSCTAHIQFNSSPSRLHMFRQYTISPENVESVQLLYCLCTVQTTHCYKILDYLFLCSKYQHTCALKQVTYILHAIYVPSVKGKVLGYCICCICSISQTCWQACQESSSTETHYLRQVCYWVSVSHMYGIPKVPWNHPKNRRLLF